MSQPVRTFSPVKLLALILLIVMVVVGVLYFLHSIGFENAIFIVVLSIGLFITGSALLT